MQLLAPALLLLAAARPLRAFHLHAFKFHPSTHHFGGAHHAPHSGARLHNGVIHRPPSAHRDAAHEPHGAGPQAGGLPPNPYDHPAGAVHQPGGGAGQHQYIPPGQAMASPGGGGLLGAMGGAGGIGGGLGNVLPAVGTGMAIAHMAGAGHHRGAGAGGLRGEWQSLAVCNAFSSQQPLTMVHFQAGMKKVSTPLLYKTCRAHDQVLAAGDRLAFQLGEETVGTFNVSRAVPRAVTVLVVARDAREGARASFVSHVFKNGRQSAALVDAYAGRASSEAKVFDGENALDFGQEQALKPGAHVLSLGKNGTDAQVPLEVPSSSAQFVLARVGEKELLVLPVPVKPILTAPPAKSSSRHRSPLLLALTGCLLATLSAK